MSLYTMIGAMSGTSMDGLDLVLCEIQSRSNDRYNYKILNAKTFGYPEDLLTLLKNSKKLPATELFELDKLLGKHYAACINQFLKEGEIDKSKVEAVASHGHTIYHQPDKGYTVQLGCGATMASAIGIRVINDFRQRDVISGGQGAPLVPIGDKMLFRNQADAYLNIGGFTNVSIPGDDTIAFDISPGNLPLNTIAEELGFPYDEGGKIARTGQLDEKVLAKLNALNYYQQEAPKSLGTEWLDESFLPVLSEIKKPKDRLHTCVHHLADQIADVCAVHHLKNLFITGGGAYNQFLMDELKNRSVDIIIPEDDVVNFKEALIFAFLGVRFLEGKYNCLASVTGASTNVRGGTLHEPK